uniref:L1 transposable element RRM domain-containing protein n=1 Tax=Rousettus aegyptiacus TaxID=9407 RepID=A0A7J8H1E0_ROUAE|nr:hypothetical protein HJG63_011265 [Rousettus aegyptiacus]
MEAKDTQSEWKEKSHQEYNNNLRNLWDKIKGNNTRVIGVPKEGEQEVEYIFEEIIMANFLNLVKEIDIQPTPGSSESPSKMNPKRPTPRHIKIKMPKIKYKENLKSNKKKAVSSLQGHAHKTGS